MAAIITTAILATVIVITLIRLNLKRGRYQPSYELQNNCLNTRYPIVFLSGKRSLFYFYKYWNWIPQFLNDHGYEIILLNLPWRKDPARRHRLKFFLQVISKEKLPAHIVADSTSTKDLQWLINTKSPWIKSCSLIEQQQLTNPEEIRPEDLRPPDDGIRRIYLPPPPTIKGFRPWSWRKVISLHNLFLSREGRLEPQTVGLPELCDMETVKQHYLDLAISLAENDVRCSH